MNITADPGSPLLQEALKTLQTLGYRLKKPLEFRICRDEEEAWNTIWKWAWFTRETWMDKYWEETRKALNPLLPLLSQLEIETILDCSCGLGFKTIVLAEAGYNAEGSDMSPTAVKYARKLAGERGLKIRFFHSRFDELAKHSRKKYDCIYSDYFDELGDREALQKSAKGIHSALKKGGKFIFSSVPPEWTRRDLKKLIEQIWRRRRRVTTHPPVEKSGVKVIHVETAHKTHEGIRENHIYIIEKKNQTLIQIATIMNPRIKWTHQDYTKTLKQAGYSKIKTIQTRQNETYIVATK